MIERAPISENKMTFEEAILYCQFCNHNGYTDWRMPTADEWICDVDIPFSSWYISDPDVYASCVVPVRDI